MAKHTVVTMPGDGIGNQVLPEALRLLEAVGFDAEYIHADIGWDCWLAGCEIPSGGRFSERHGAYLAAGMQQLVDAVRSTGATQPLMLGGTARRSALREARRWLALLDLVDAVDDRELI